MTDHRVRVTSDACFVKGRLGQTPLPPVQIAFAREETLAEQPLGPFERAPFLEQSRARDQDVLDEVRMVEEDETLVLLL